MHLFNKRLFVCTCEWQMVHMRTAICTGLSSSSTPYREASLLKGDQMGGAQHILLTCYEAALQGMISMLDHIQQYRVLV